MTIIQAKFAFLDEDHGFPRLIKVLSFALHRPSSLTRPTVLQRKRTPTDELTEFWNLPQEDFDACDPLQWWYGRRAQFPQLYRLVRDIFSIPGTYLYLSFLIIKLIYCLSLGSAVAVERIFSGGRDTISLRRASLKPETIRVLMLVKRKLIVAREKVVAKLRH
jgi:hypothetical protein